MTTSSDDAGNATRPTQPVPTTAWCRPFWITALNYVEQVIDD